MLRFVLFEARQTLPIAATALVFFYLAARQLRRPPRGVFYGKDALLANRPKAIAAANLGFMATALLAVAGFVTGIPAVWGAAAVAMGSLLLGAYLLAFMTVRARCVAFAVAAASVTAWWLWPNWLTTDVLALVVAFATVAFLQQFTSALFVPVAVLGLGLFAFDIVGEYVTRFMAHRTENAVAHWSPTAFVVPAHLGLDAQPVAWLGGGDFICIGSLIVAAAVVAWRDRRIHMVVGGLAGCLVGFVAIESLWFAMRHSQPALVGLYPCTMAGIVLVAWRTGHIRELVVWSAKEKKA